MTKKVPIFNTEEEEALFWDEHDSTEFIEDFEPLEIELSKELEDEILSKRELKKPVTLRLEPSQIDAVKKIAGQKGLPYQTLIRLWITEKIKNPGSGI
ncbi:CopG family antitoxin [Paradesulfitobacterium ferrireducens]|uniref:CopG family antitoxin n=1 Tax=Paradesulfitobacterium ferrireducens TaxID=2816476 RepID=UPI001A8ECFA3|nr:CopG family antitoxin [Paradesulfitobacterium ferrireducens]